MTKQNTYKRILEYIRVARATGDSDKADGASDALHIILDSDTTAPPRGQQRAQFINKLRQ